ncbi:MAG: lasso peptide biosynthesis B2 protein [Gemmatimonadaceae bacterium]
MAPSHLGALARRFFSLGAAGWLDLWRAQWGLLRAQREIGRRAAGTLTARDAIADPASPSVAGPAPARAHELGTAVRRMSKYGLTRPACLVQAMALRELLAAHGMQGAVIRVGVKQAEAGMLAHAWVELAGDVIGDSRAHVSQYQILEELNVVP